MLEANSAYVLFGSFESCQKTKIERRLIKTSIYNEDVEVKKKQRTEQFEGTIKSPDWTDLSCYLQMYIKLYIYKNKRK